MHFLLFYSFWHWQDFLTVRSICTCVPESLPVPVGEWQGQTLAVESSPAPQQWTNSLLDCLGAGRWLTGDSWLTGDGWLVGMVLCFRISGLPMNTFLSCTAGRGALCGQYWFSLYPCFCCLSRCLCTCFSICVPFITISMFFQCSTWFAYSSVCSEVVCASCCVCNIIRKDQQQC